MKMGKRYLLPIILILIVFALRYSQYLPEVMMWILTRIPYGHRLRYLVKWGSFFILGMAFAIFPDGEKTGD